MEVLEEVNGKIQLQEVNVLSREGFERAWDIRHYGCASKSCEHETNNRQGAHEGGFPETSKKRNIWR